MIEILLLISILLCGLVSGLVFTFAILIMPSFESLTDLDYLQRFKDMDTIIQKNHPLFYFGVVGFCFGHNSFGCIEHILN